MSFKSLFFKDEQNVPVEQKTIPEPVAFPTQVAFPTSVPNLANCQPHIETIMALYEKGFNDLNKPGYDFFEFFKAVTGVGIDNPLAYQMALSMGVSMDSSVNKDKLITEADYYINEINNVYKTYVNNGNSKKEKTLNTLAEEKTGLTNNLNQLKQEALELANKISKLELELQNVDSKYKTGLDEIECKLMANDLAKKKIIDSISSVRSGIINNLK